MADRGERQRREAVSVESPPLGRVRVGDASKDYGAYRGSYAMHARGRDTPVDEPTAARTRRELTPMRAMWGEEKGQRGNDRLRPTTARPGRTEPA
jgi:hypothetical protein